VHVQFADAWPNGPCAQGATCVTVPLSVEATEVDMGVAAGEGPGLGTAERRLVAGDHREDCRRLACPVMRVEGPLYLRGKRTGRDGMVAGRAPSRYQ
jgi:hypothetical protein